MSEQVGVDWLEDRGFQLVGCWSQDVLELQDNKKLKRHVPLQRIPGIYAFVVDGKVRYLGKASYLRSRLRAYNRSLREPTARGFRGVHRGIHQAWSIRSVIDVWTFNFVPSSNETLEQLEARWIKEIKLDWNAPLKV